MKTTIRNPEYIDKPTNTQRFNNKNDVINQAHQKAPATLFLSAVGGVIGALKGGSKGALIGLGVGGLAGYIIDNINTSPNTSQSWVETTSTFFLFYPLITNSLKLSDDF